MPGTILEKLIEHNNWANDQIIRACSILSDAQLDAAPKSPTMGTIRETLLHMVSAQLGYYRLLTTPVEERRKPGPPLAFDKLQESSDDSGRALLALVQDESRIAATGRLETRDGFWVEPWLVLVQVINHATEHREQIKSMLTSLGVTPPEIDGWMYGEATHTVVPVGQAKKD